MLQFSSGSNRWIRKIFYRRLYCWCFDIAGWTSGQRVKGKIPIQQSWPVSTICMTLCSTTYEGKLSINCKNHAAFIPFGNQWRQNLMVALWTLSIALRLRMSNCVGSIHLPRCILCNLLSTWHGPCCELFRYDYVLAREYNWNVKNKASRGYEENYFFVVKEDGVYYNELETRWIYLPLHCSLPFGLSPFPKCIIIMCQSKHKYIFYAINLLTFETVWQYYCCQ